MPYFGGIKNEKQVWSPIGVMADILWYEIKNHATDISLGEFVVMPNHIHGILVLNNTGDSRDRRDKACLVSTVARPPTVAPTPPPKSQKTIGQQRFQNQGKNTISSMVGGYKSAVTKHARRLGFEFAWQPRFWDHVIRDEFEYQRIATYIRNNPKKWENDKLNGGDGNKVLDECLIYGEEDWMR